MTARLGFVGTGTITQAIVTGLCTAPGSPPEIWVSPRSETRARALAASYPNVHVATSNQQVLDHADTVLLAVLPVHARAVLEPLLFRESHRCISLIAGLAQASLLPLVAPASRCVRATPTPTVASRRGPIALFPPEPDTEALFASIGVPIAVAEERHFDALLACSAEMASFFRLLQSCTQFLVAHGLADTSARQYTAALFDALGYTANHSTELGFDQLAEDHQTPGGINEQLARELMAGGVFTAHVQGLERILQRLTAAASAGTT